MLYRITFLSSSLLAAACTAAVSPGVQGGVVPTVVVPSPSAPSAPTAPANPSPSPAAPTASLTPSPAPLKSVAVLRDAIEQAAPIDQVVPVLMVVRESHGCIRSARAEAEVDDRLHQVRIKALALDVSGQGFACPQGVRDHIVGMAFTPRVVGVYEVLVNGRDVGDLEVTGPGPAHPLANEPSGTLALDGASRSIKGDWVPVTRGHEGATYSACDAPYRRYFLRQAAMDLTMKVIDVTAVRDRERATTVATLGAAGADTFFPFSSPDESFDLRWDDAGRRLIGLHQVGPGPEAGGRRADPIVLVPLVVGGVPEGGCAP